MIDPQLLDILMRGNYGGGYGGPTEHTDLDMGGMGLDPSDEPRGNSLQDLYDFLMTPRHRRETSISPHGRFTHYGPSRSPSISPQDKASAEFIMEQMRKEEDRKMTMDRFRKSEETMTGRGPKAGGTISTHDKKLPATEAMGVRFPSITVPGASATIESKGPMTSQDRTTAQGGGYPSDRVLESEAYNAGRGGMTGSSVESQVRLNLQNAEDAKKAALDIDAKFQGERMKYPELDPYKDLDLAKLTEMLHKGELPPHVERLIAPHGNERQFHIEQQKLWLDRAAAVGKALPGGGVRGVEGYLAGDGQIAIPGHE